MRGQEDEWNKWGNNRIQRGIRGRKNKREEKMEGVEKEVIKLRIY